MAAGKKGTFQSILSLVRLRTPPPMYHPREDEAGRPESHQG
jgi:hypothetical protein